MLHVEDHPEFVIDAAIRKQCNQSVRKYYDHVLKVVGKEEYLYGQTPLCQFKVRELFYCIVFNAIFNIISIMTVASAPILAFLEYVSQATGSFPK